MGQLLYKFKLQMILVVKNLPPSAGQVTGSGSVPGLGRSPGEENGNPLHILAWRIPQTEEPGRLQSMGSQKSDVTEATTALSYIAPVHSILADSVGKYRNVAYLGAIPHPESPTPPCLL